MRKEFLLARKPSVFPDGTLYQQVLRYVVQEVVSVHSWVIYKDPAGSLASGKVDVENMGKGEAREHYRTCVKERGYSPQEPWISPPLDSLPTNIL